MEATRLFAQRFSRVGRTSITQVLGQRKLLSTRPIVVLCCASLPDEVHRFSLYKRNRRQPGWREEHDSYNSCLEGL